MTTAKFTINATAAALRGYDALNSEGLSFQLEDSPALDVLACVYSVVIASPSAPALTLSGSGIASPPTAAVTTSAPSSGAHSYIIRCTITTDQGTQTFERLVCTRTLGARKIAPGETVQHDPTYGWTKAWSDLIDSYVAALAATEKPAVKLPVRVATTTAVAHAGLLTIDGVTLLAGDRVLDKDHGTASLRGIWVADAGAWTRATDFDSSDEVFAGVIVPVTEGTLSADTIWILTTDGAITVGSTSLAFTNITVPAALGADAVVETTGGGQLTATANTKGVSAATASTYVKRDGSAGAAFGYVSVGSSPAASGDLRVPDIFAAKAGAGAVAMLESTASLFTLGAASRDLLVNAKELEIQVDASGVNVTSTAGGELDVQVPSGIFNVNAAAAVSCVGGAASTFGCTVGALTLGAADNATTATLSAGTAGNAVSVACSSSADAITCTVNGTAALALSTTAATLGVPSVTWGETVTAPTIGQAARTTDAAPRGITISSQTPYASAAGANRDPQPITLSVPAPAGASTAESYVQIKISGAERAQIGRYSAVFNDGNSAKPVRIGAQINAGVASLNYAAIYFGSNASSPSATNYAFLGDNTDTYLNAAGIVYLLKGGNAHTSFSESGGTWTVSIGASATPLSITAAAAAATIAANKAQALTISIGAQTSEAAPKDMTLQPGAPWGSASSAANKKPGDLVINLNTPTSGGTDHGRIIEQRGSSKVYSYYKELQTTDASSQVVFAFTMSDNTKVAFKAVLLSSRTDSGTAVDGADLFAVFKRRGGGATVVGAMSTDLKEDLAYTSITATVSGNDAQITIQMRGAETWQHDVWIDVYETGTA